MGDATLREIEERNETTAIAWRSAQSASTEPPDESQVPKDSRVPDVTCPPEAPFTVIQTVLQSACRRKKLPSSGTKQKLTEILSRVGVTTAADVRTLALEF